MEHEKDRHLTSSEEDLMEIFWAKKVPLTSVELLELSTGYSWNGKYLHRMLRSLLKKEMLEVCGIAPCGTQYARQFQPIVTKEQYAARLVMSKGMGINSIAGIAVAMVDEADESEEEELIQQLEGIIEELKKKGSLEGAE